MIDQLHKVVSTCLASNIVVLNYPEVMLLHYEVKNLIGLVLKEVEKGKNFTIRTTSLQIAEDIGWYLYNKFDYPNDISIEILDFSVRVAKQAKNDVKKEILSDILQHITNIRKNL